MSAEVVHADFDPVKAEAFAGRLLGALNDGALCLMVSVGHRTGLFDIMSTSFFVSRRTIVPSTASDALPAWKRKLFTFLTRNAADPTTFFHLPPGRVVELGTQVSL